MKYVNRRPTLKSLGVFAAGGTMVLACATAPNDREDTGRVSEAVSTACTHDVLCTGGPLQKGSGTDTGCTTTSGANSYCVPEVCADYPSCCSTAWTNTCVQDMLKYTKQGGFSYNDCPVPTANPAPACSSGDAGADSGSKDAGSGTDSGTDSGSGGSCGECKTHSTPLTSSCDSCTGAVCSHDSYCCKTAWDSQCVGEVTTYCGASACSADAGAPDSGASDSGASDTGAADTGAPDTGANDSGKTEAGGPDGGTVTLPAPTLAPVTLSKLSFGIIGDTRPAQSQTTGYSTSLKAVIGSVFTGLQSQGVPFTVATGDYAYSSTSAGSAVPQYDDYMTARANFTGKYLPTMGNHECNGYTDSNCPIGSFTGMTQDYINTIVQPSTGQSSPYYSALYTAADGTWTAKFIFIAANAWNTTQQSWLQSTLAVPTTYTFTIRHEPANANTAPGTTPSENLISPAFSAGELTLSMTGHTHLVQLPGGTQPYGDPYGSTQPYEIIIGNGGAPLDAGSTYGYAIATRRASDGAIVTQLFESADSSSNPIVPNVADPNFRFAVNANGTPNSNTTLP
jgi:hypothetical protein